MQRTIQHIIYSTDISQVGNGFMVNQFIPSAEVDVLSQQRMNPFVLVHYTPSVYFEPSTELRGVDTHPHRGIDVVTIAYKGSIAHKDNSGGKGVVRPGDVQWMTSGRGILHNEFHDEEFTSQGGELQMAQIWVNLPSEFKMTNAGYQNITNNIIPKVSLGSNGYIEVIAGSYKYNKGIAKTFSPINVYNVYLNDSGKVDLNFPSNYNTALLIIKGEAIVNQQLVKENNFILLNNDGDTFAIEAKSYSIVLVLSGEPINEPIVSYGPFVMNSVEEIKQAFADYRAGNFGIDNI